MQHVYGPDGSTGLYDEALFLELLDREVARARRYARPLSLILGRALKEKAVAPEVLARGWMALARDVDFGAKLGDGLRWAMALPETGRAGATIAAERFRRGLDALTDPGPCPLALGVVTHPYHGATAAALLESADSLSRGTDLFLAVAEYNHGDKL